MMMRRDSSTSLMLAGGALALVALVLWWPHLDQGLYGAIAAVPLATALHVMAAVLFGLGGARVSSRSMAPFYFLLAVMLPMLGMLTVLGLNSVLGTDSQADEEDEDLDFGNPVLGRPHAGVAEVFPKPIARMMREADKASIGRMILGLSKNGGADRGHQILRRYQQDRDVELQFYAQNAQRGATESLELHLKNLRAQLQSAADDPALCGALSEVLIGLADRRTTSSSDAHAYLRRAAEHLKKLPESARRAALEVRVYLLLKEPANARMALEKLPGGDLRRSRLEAEVLFAQRDWKRLEKCAKRLESSDIQVRTARNFWCGEA